MYRPLHTDNYSKHSNYMHIHVFIGQKLAYPILHTYPIMTPKLSKLVVAPKEDPLKTPYPQKMIFWKPLKNKIQFVNSLTYPVNLKINMLSLFYSFLFWKIRNHLSVVINTIDSFVVLYYTITSNIETTIPVYSWDRMGSKYCYQPTGHIYSH